MHLIYLNAHFRINYQNHHFNLMLDLCSSAPSHRFEWTRRGYCVTTTDLQCKIRPYGIQSEFGLTCLRWVVLSHFPFYLLLSSHHNITSTKHGAGWKETSKQQKVLGEYNGVLYVVLFHVSFPMLRTLYKRMGIANVLSNTSFASKGGFYLIFNKAVTMA